MRIDGEPSRDRPGQVSTGKEGRSQNGYEAHHCLSDSYQKVLNHFDGANVLGVTATPDRGDQKNLGEYFDSKAYEYSMASAIRDGYLCPIKAQMIPLKLDLGSVGISNGDFAVNDIGSALDPYLRQIADAMVYYCKGRKTVVFLPLIATSQKFCAMLNEAGLSAVEINGNSPDREQILQDFDNGHYDVLCNSMLLTEGWDCPCVDCIVVLRPTKIRSLYQQMVGRGMRLFPGKDHARIVERDAVAADRHRRVKAMGYKLSSYDLVAFEAEAGLLGDTLCLLPFFAGKTAHPRGLPRQRGGGERGPLQTRRTGAKVLAVLLPRLIVIHHQIPPFSLYSAELIIAGLLTRWMGRSSSLS